MTVRELWSAIRKKCLHCTNHLPKEVRLCRVYDCPTWPYRMGKNHPVQVSKTGCFTQNQDSRET